jgi:hypothetical protein
MLALPLQKIKKELKEFFGEEVLQREACAGSISGGGLPVFWFFKTSSSGPRPHFQPSGSATWFRSVVPMWSELARCQVTLEASEVKAMLRRSLLTLHRPHVPINHLHFLVPHPATATPDLVTCKL